MKVETLHEHSPNNFNQGILWLICHYRTVSWQTFKVFYSLLLSIRYLQMGPPAQVEGCEQPLRRRHLAQVSPEGGGREGLLAGGVEDLLQGVLLKPHQRPVVLVHSNYDRHPASYCSKCNYF